MVRVEVCVCSDGAGATGIKRWWMLYGVGWLVMRNILVQKREPGNITRRRIKWDIFNAPNQTDPIYAIKTCSWGFQKEATSCSCGLLRFSNQGNLIQGEGSDSLKTALEIKGRQLGDMQQSVFIIVNSILVNLLSCLPFGLQTGFSSFPKLAEPSPV